MSEELVYRKSSFSGGGENCVEVAFTSTAVYVRNSKRPHEDPKVFTHDEWNAFTLGAKAGEFDL